jgi:SAM-dependent methyltransferase
MMLCCISVFSGCSGGSSKQEEISTEPLHLETEDGILSYKTQEYVSNGFSTDEGADPSKLICIEFDFTNKSDTPKTVNSVFNINVFQNGVELELNPYSYRTEAAPEAYNNIFRECMNGSTITVGLIYVLNDDSPLTISASPLMSQDEKPVQMLLDVIPYEDNSFDIVINRHGDFCPREIRRVLKRGGVFVTQQVGAENDRELIELLYQKELPLAFPEQYLEPTAEKFRKAGFSILDARETFRTMKFLDVGALVWFARIIQWEFPDFSVDSCLPGLQQAQHILETCGCIEGQIHRFLLAAKKEE